MNRDDFLTRILVTDQEFVPFYEERYVLKDKYPSLVLFPEELVVEKTVYYSWNWDMQTNQNLLLQKARTDIAYVEKECIYNSPDSIEVYESYAVPSFSFMTSFDGCCFFLDEIDAWGYFCAKRSQYTKIRGKTALKRRADDCSV